MNRVESFDIWGTCLTRTVGNPYLVFAEAARLLSTPGDDAAGLDLARARRDAETAARHSVPDGECTFDEIIHELGRRVGPELAEKFRQSELGCERALVRSIVATKRRIQTARQGGARIVFLSDMYLPATFLRELLEEQGMALPGDPVFVSGEHRASKASGRLFPIAAAAVGVELRHWRHHGDNWRADVANARRHGARAVLIPDDSWTETEGRAFARSKHAPAAGLQIAGAMRAARLSAESALPDETIGFLAGVAAPWLTALCARIIRRARRRGIKRLYFLSRDGEVLLCIFRALAPPDIECRYLYASRRAWSFPAMFDDTVMARRWLEAEPSSPETFLKALEFGASERKAVLEELNIAGPESRLRWPPRQLERIWDHLRSTRRLDSVLARAAQAREVLVDYFRQEGMFDGQSWGVVDVGWSLSTQAALARVLRSVDPKIKPHGFYFMVRSFRPSIQDTGPFDAWVVEEACGETRVSLFGRLSSVIEELFFASSDPTVVGFHRDARGSVVPDVGPAASGQTNAAYADALRGVSVAFATNVRPWIDNEEFVATLDGIALAEFERFLTIPTRAEVGQFRDLVHVTDAGGDLGDAKPLVSEFTWIDLFQIVARRAGFVSRPQQIDRFWHAGSMAATPAFIRVLVAGALRPFRLVRPH